MGYDWNKHKADDDNGDSRFVKFTEKGQKASGRIIDINETTFGGSRPDAVPNLVLEQPDGSVKEVGCSQTNLLRQLAAAEPEVGDTITIEYLGEGPKTPGKNPPKLFRVDVGKGSPADVANGTKAPSADDSEPF